MSRVAQVAHFALGCEYSPVEIGPGLASIVAARKEPGKVSCICRGLYPFYQAIFEKSSSKYIAFFDGYSPGNMAILVMPAQVLQAAKDGLIELSETSRTENAINKLRTLKKELQKKDQKLVLGAVSRDVADILFSFFKSASVENISDAVSFQPNIDENELADSMKDVLYGETETRKSLESMVESVQTNMVGRFQKNVDESLECLKIEKTDKIEKLTQNLVEHESYVNSLQNNLNKLQNVINDNTILLNEVNARLRDAQQGQTEYRDIAESYRLKPIISDLKRQKEEAKGKMDELLQRQEALRESLKKENKVIESLQREIQRIRDYLPEDLKRGIDNLDSLQTEFKDALGEFKYVDQNSKELLDNSLTLSEDALPSDTHSHDLTDNLSVSLCYVPFYFIEMKRALGISSSDFTVAPCSLPNSIDEIGTDALSKHLIQAIDSAPKSDYSSLRKAASEFNILKRKGGKELVQQGIDYIMEQQLVKGLE